MQQNADTLLIRQNYGHKKRPTKFRNPVNVPSP